MTAPEQPIVFFTDLDGTLLDHETYSYAAASQALELLHEHSIPLVIASSKTAAEIAPLREALGFGHCPAIVENGAGILEPGIAQTDGEKTYQRLLAAIDQIDTSLRNEFRGFSQFSVEEIANTTSLTLEAAEKAKARQFSEPGLWRGSRNALTRFKQCLSDQGITAQQGGRFISLSFGGNKADRMREIARRYENETSAFTVALGDSLNDINMLRSADLGFIVANPRGAPIQPLDEEKQRKIIRTTLPGPSGWNNAVIDVLKRLKQGDAGEG